MEIDLSTVDLPTIPYFRHSFFLFWTLCDPPGVAVKRAKFVWFFFLGFATTRHLRMANGTPPVWPENQNRAPQRRGSDSSGQTPTHRLWKAFFQPYLIRVFRCQTEKETYQLLRGSGSKVSLAGLNKECETLPRLFYVFNFIGHSTATGVVSWKKSMHSRSIVHSKKKKTDPWGVFEFFQMFWKIFQVSLFGCFKDTFPCNCQKNSPSLFRLSLLARAARRMIEHPRQNDRILPSPILFFQSKKGIKLIPKTIRNRKRVRAWGGVGLINYLKHKLVRWTERTPSWFVLCDL